MAALAVAITGATGYLGTHLSRRLVQQGVAVTCLLRTGSESKLATDLQGRVRVLSTDETPEKLAQGLRDHSVSALLHLATHFVAEHSDASIPLLIESNIALGTRIAEATALAGCQRFLNIGSFWQHFEGEAYSPASLYAATKKAFEDILHYYSAVRGLSVINLKFAAVYGPSDPRAKIINLLFKSAQAQTRLALSGGEQLMDLIYVDDAVQAVLAGLKVLESSAPSSQASFSVSSEQSLSLRNFVQIMEDSTGQKPPIDWGAKPYRQREFFKDWVFDPPLPNWAPQVTLKDGLKQVFLHFPN